MIVAKVFSQYPTQVSFTKHNHMIQTFTPNAADLVRYMDSATVTAPP